MKLKRILRPFYGGEVKKCVRIMKLSCFLILVLTLQSSASLWSQNKMDVAIKNQSLLQLFTQVEKNSKYRFFYSNDEVDVHQKVTVEVKDKTIGYILTEAFSDLPYSFKEVKDNMILVELNKSIGTSVKQQRSVSGKVADNNGESLPGVTVRIKGTTNGTVTNIDGEYTLSGVSAESILQFSFVGMLSKEVVVGEKNVINVRLVPDEIGINEVVVTALGIRRDKKALGYATSSIDSKAIEESGESNVLNALKGKVAGLNISGSNGLSDEGASITIRGHSSISGNSQALVIVDGVPSSLDVIPNDVENVTVLRGANASALYGSEGANGVILITTKKANKEKGLGVNINSGVTFISATSLPDLQNIYGQGKGEVGKFQAIGEDGIPLLGGGTKDESWGPKMEGQMVRINWLRHQPVVPFDPQPDNIKDLYDTGVLYTNSASISYATDRTTYYGSFLYRNADEYVPTARTNKAFVNLRVTHQVTDRLSFDVKIDADKAEGHNRPSNGHTSAMNLATHPRSIRLQDINMGKYPESGKDWGQSHWQDGQPIMWTTTRNNDQYFWNLYFDTNEDYSKNFNGNFKVEYKISDWLNFMARYSHKEGVSGYSQIKAINSWNTPKGSYTKSDRQYTSYKSYFLFSGNKDFFDGDFNINGTFGGRQAKDEGSRTWFKGDEFVMEGLETPNNTKTKNYDYNEWDHLSNSLYGNVQLGYKGMMYVDFTGRNDWTSSLPKNNNSFFYPSITGSIIFSEILNIDKDILGFGKIRASYAEVGSGGGGNIHRSYGFYTSVMGATYAGNPHTLPNKDLVPERTESVEFGTELSFLKNRISLDATYYKANTFNQILGSQPLAATTGYTGRSINGGNIENKGVELALATKNIVSNDFTWETNLTFAKNKSEVVSLGEDVSTQIDFGGNRAVRIVAIPGNSLFTITGRGFQRNDQGQILIKTTGSDRGIALQTDDYIELGKVEPDWTGSIRNSFNYNGLNFYFQIDGSFGGHFYGSNNQWFDEQGVSVRSLNGREGWMESEEARQAAGVSSSEWHNTGGVDVWVDNNTVLYDESLVGEDGIQVGGVLNSGKDAIYSDPRKFWDRNRFARAEHNIESATFVKLREVGLSYRLPKQIIEKLPFKDVSASLIANNYWMIYKKARHADPDAYRQGNDKSFLGYTGDTAMPTKTLSFKLNLKF
ncbi:SusC/RagA family TonB-linked outer membrane protein [Puteibacter caeruleilacunae]|nr:SusC/RagA family TonB-linked outer membrane protein [Puteibacter caeruleilacunae]